MAFDETLAARVRKKIGQRSDVVEKKMFGGVAFLLNGNMSVGVHGDELIVRIPQSSTSRNLTYLHEGHPGGKVVVTLP
jgi:TfoX/Sxy family transcriptional regulator of competence genes